MTKRERATIRNEQGALVLAAMIGENLTCTALSANVLRKRAERTERKPRTRLGETL